MAWTRHVARRSACSRGEPAVRLAEYTEHYREVRRGCHAGYSTVLSGRGVNARRPRRLSAVCWGSPLLSQEGAFFFFSGPPLAARTEGALLSLGIDPGYTRFAYRVPLASDGRGPVVFSSPP